MSAFYATDLDAVYASTESDRTDDMNDAHDFAVWQFGCAVRDLMENHGYTETELAAMVIEAMPLAEEMEFELTIPTDIDPFK